MELGILNTQMLLNAQNPFPKFGNKIYSMTAANLWSYVRHRTYRVTPAPSSWAQLLYVSNRTPPHAGQRSRRNRTTLGRGLFVMRLHRTHSNTPGGGQTLCPRRAAVFTVEMGFVPMVCLIQSFVQFFTDLRE